MLLSNVCPSIRIYHSLFHYIRLIHSKLLSSGSCAEHSSRETNSFTFHLCVWKINYICHCIDFSSGKGIIIFSRFVTWYTVTVWSRCSTCPMNLLMHNTFLLRFLLNTETANGSHKFSSICHFLSRLKTKLLCLSLSLSRMWRRLHLNVNIILPRKTRDFFSVSNMIFISINNSSEFDLKLIVLQGNCIAEGSLV